MDLRRRAQKCVEKEYGRFKKKMVYKSSREEVWEACAKIHFYLCMKEYFELNDRIPEEYLELAQAEPELIEKAWRTYLADERLEYRTWTEIDRLLEEVFLKWKLPLAA